jgi:Ala-tRNA(Pro) deacylase
MAIPAKLARYLDDKKVPYEILHHPEAFTAQTIAEAEHIKGRHHAKVVMVKSGDQDLMVVLAADRKVDLEKLEKITGQAAALETEAEFKDLFPDCAPGTMPPFGELYGVPTYVDSGLAKEDYIVFEAGNHTDAIKLSFNDYQRVAKPQLGDFGVKFYPAKRSSP